MMHETGKSKDSLKENFLSEMNKNIRNRLDSLEQQHRENIPSEISVDMEQEESKGPSIQ